MLVSCIVYRFYHYPNLFVVQPFSSVHKDFISGSAKFSIAKRVRRHIKFGNTGLSQHQ